MRRPGHRHLVWLALPMAAACGCASAAAPSFDCSAVEAGSIEAMICADADFAALDRKMANVYAEARQKAANEHPPVLKSEQRGWIKGRNECWKSEDQRSCVEQSYRLRVAELQARYRLIEGTGPVTYVCNGNPADTVIATFFPTEPPTAEVERGDQVSLMYLQPSASGARYVGRNESLWEHHGEALVSWGYGSPEMKCVKQ